MYMQCSPVAVASNRMRSSGQGTQFYYFSGCVGARWALYLGVPTRAADGGVS